MSNEFGSAGESFRVGGPPPAVLVPFFGLFGLVGAVFWVTAIRNVDPFLSLFLVAWTGIAVSNGYRFFRSPQRIETTPAMVRFVRTFGADIEVSWSSLTQVKGGRYGWQWTWVDGKLAMPFPPTESYRLLRAVETYAPHVQLEGV